MSNLGNKYKVGVFAVTAFIIFIIGLISLGTFKYFRQTYDFMTVVTASVQGLEKGAKVKIKGVTIGSVAKVQLSPDMGQIYIFMKFDKDAFAKATSKKLIQDSELKHMSRQQVLDVFSESMSEHVKKGLRCQLMYGDITGNLFVEIAVFDPNKNPPQEFELPEDHPPYVPSLPTVTIGNIMDEIHRATENIAQMDLKRVSDQMNAFLEKANNIMNEQDFRRIVKEVESISSNLDELILRVKDVLDKKHLEEMTQSVQKTFDNFNSTLDAIEKLAEESSSELKNAKMAETSEKARNLLDNSNTAVKNLDALRAELKNDMNDLKNTLKSAKDLLDYLERNPNSLISGKPDKPVVDPE
ncbi:MAG: MlaD family protein [Victivallales bacterium]|jgi:paraquat-inducible protein B